MPVHQLDVDTRAGGHSGPPLRGMHLRKPAAVVECARYGSLLKS